MTCSCSKLWRLGVLSAMLDVCQKSVMQKATANIKRNFTGCTPGTLYGGEMVMPLQADFFME